MTSPEPKTSLPTTDSSTSEAPNTAASTPAENPELVAVEGEADRAPAPPAPEIQRAEPAARRGRNWLAWLLAAILLIGVVLYVQQLQQTQRLEGEVTALSADLAAANAKVEAHERQMGLIRDHVGDIFARMAALQTLVGGEVVAEEAPPVIETPEPMPLPVDPGRVEVEPSAPPLTQQEAYELGLPYLDRSSSDLQAEFEGMTTF